MKTEKQIDIKDMTEAQMRKYEVPWPKTKKNLNKFIGQLVDREHDYGTSVYAVSLASVATFYYMAHKIGITGFQASCADMDIMKRTRSLKHGFKIIDFEHLLYPQYLNSKHFPSWQQLIEEHIEMLAKKAKKLLRKSPDAHQDVKNHWKYLVDYRRT